MSAKAIRYPKNFYAIILFVIAAAVGIIGMYYHEMWRDESQAFLLVRDSKNLVKLWQNVRYEGHPILWYLVLYLFYHLVPSIYTTQVVHLAIGLSVVALIIWYSPFTFLQKVLLVSSYFFSYEYLIISRNYAIGILLLFAAIIVFHKKKNDSKLALVALLLGLSANANIYSLVISFWLFLYFLWQTAANRREQTTGWRGLILPVIMFALLNIVAVMQIIPPKDRTPIIRIAYRVRPQKLDRVFGEVAETMFYLADIDQNEKYWGSDYFKHNISTNGFFNGFFHHIPAILAFAIIALLLFACRKNKQLAFLFVSAFTSLFLFTYMVFDKGFLRHTGAFFILFIIVYWIYRNGVAENSKTAILLKNLFIVMLTMQVISSVFVHIKDVQYPFSGAKDAATFLIAKRDTANILIQPDFYGMSVIHYAHLPSVFYAISESRGSFIKFTSVRKRKSNNDIYRIIQSQNIQTLIFNSRLSDSLLTKWSFKTIYKPLSPSTVGEDFFIYARK